MSLFNESILDNSPSGESLYLSKGINSDVMIGAIEGVIPETGSPYISVALFKKGSNPETDSRVFKFYMSEKAQGKSLEKLIHLAKEVISKEDIRNINNNSKTLEEFASHLSAALKGATIKWFKLCAEQYINAEGKIRDRLTIGLPRFASQKETCPLKWDETKSHDYKRLDTSATVGSTAKEKSDGLPF